MKDSKRILIVGGVAGGASAAARARRLSEDAEIIMFERSDYISFANCGLPYHIGHKIADRDKLLVQTPAAMRKRFKIDVRTATEVLKVDRKNKCLLVRDLKNGKETSEHYDKLILSPGAEAVKPEIAGAESELVFTLRSMNDMDLIKEVVDHRSLETAVVIGSGFIGLETAEALTERGVKVCLVELLDQVFNPFDPEMALTVQQQLEGHGIDVRLGTSVTGFTQTDQTLSVQLSDSQYIDCGMAVMAIGVKPEVNLAADAGLKIGQRSGIVVNDHMLTSDPDIYAVGDAIEVTDFVGGFQAHIPLAGPANRQGRIAADNIFGIESTYRKTQGTAICKIFDIAAAMTGLNEKLLKHIGLPYEKVYVHPSSHAGYYPGAAPISLKLLFDPDTGKILGAQATGQKGVDKRIDVISVAMRAGMTVFDLQDLELCYAPPFGSAKDPVNYAGFVAANSIKKQVKLCHSPGILNVSEDQIILDVRTIPELKSGAIDSAVVIPLDELRDRLAELPKDKEILVCCKVGLRGYLACRILTQHGFKCRNLTGGFNTFLAYLKAHRQV